jgi:hypothetical protein
MLDGSNLRASSKVPPGAPRLFRGKIEESVFGEKLGRVAVMF